MKWLVSLFALFVGVACATDGYYFARAAEQRQQEQDQYFSQDALGQYAYGYSGPLSSKQEARSLDGVTRGSYQYIDGSGELQYVQYIADANGFRIIGATNLPRAVSQAPAPVQETSEVRTARAQHLAAYEQTKLRRPVEDTAEVAAAKRDFFRRYEEVRARNEWVAQNRGIAYAYSKTSSQPTA